MINSPIISTFKSRTLALFTILFVWSFKFNLDILDFNVSPIIRIVIRNSKSLVVITIQAITALYWLQEHFRLIRRFYLELYIKTDIYSDLYIEFCVCVEQCMSNLHAFSETNKMSNYLLAKVSHFINCMLLSYY